MDRHLRRSLRIQGATLALVLGAAASGGDRGQAADWNLTTGGGWGTASNWTPATVPNAADTVADFSKVDITTSSTVTLGAARTVGSLVFGDTDPATLGSWTVTNSGTDSQTLTLSATSGTSTITVQTGTVTIAAKPVSSQIVQKTGPGTLAWTYGTAAGSGQLITGTAVVAAGVWQWNNLFSSPNVVLDGGTSRYVGAATTTGRSLVTIGPGGGGFDMSGSGVLTMSSTAAMAYLGTGDRQITFGGSTTATGSQAIGDVPGGGTVSIRKVGTNTWTLAATSTFSGPVTIDQGTLQIGNAGSTGGIGNGAVSIAAGGTFAFRKNAAATLANAISGSGGFTQWSGDNVVTLTNGTYTGQTTVLRGIYANASPATSNVVLGTNNSRFDYGILDLSAGDFTGPLGTAGGGSVSWATATASGGFVRMASGTSVVAIGGVATPAAVALGQGGFYGGSDTTATNNDPRMSFGDVGGIALGTVDFRNPITLTNPVVPAQSCLKLVVNGVAAKAAILSGDISGTGASGGAGQALVKFGNGSLWLSGSNTYVGSTSIGGQGAIVLGSANAFSPSTWFVLDGGTSTAAGVLGLAAGDLAANLGTTGGNVAFQGSASSGGFAAFGADRSVTLSSGSTLTWGTTPNFLGTGRLILGLASADATVTLANPLDLGGAARTIVANNGAAAVDARLGGAIQGAGSLVKDGLGTLELIGVNTYSGTTAVLAGTLLVNGTAGGPQGAASVASGARLGGAGSLGGGIAIASGGILAPGDGIGVLTSGSAVAFAAGSTLASEINTSTLAADLLAVSGDLTTTTGATLSLIDLAGSSATVPAGTILSLVNYGGTWSGGLFSFNGTPLTTSDTFAFGANTWQIDYASTSAGSNVSSPLPSGLFLNITVVPEPSVFALIIGAGVAAACRWRRRS
jgi:fibronectin-binding autotransporter adhesin